MFHVPSTGEFFNPQRVTLTDTLNYPILLTLFLKVQNPIFFKIRLLICKKRNFSSWTYNVQICTTPAHLAQSLNSISITFFFNLHISFVSSKMLFLRKSDPAACFVICFGYLPFTLITEKGHFLSRFTPRSVRKKMKKHATGTKLSFEFSIITVEC